MVGLPHLLGGLALGLTASVSASPFAYQGLNSTSPVSFTNYTTTTTVKSTATLHDIVIAGSSIAGPVAVSPISSVPIADKVGSSAGPATKNGAPTAAASAADSSQNGSGAAAQGAIQVGGATAPMSSVSSAAAYGAVKVAVVSQSFSPASFQTVVVTETVASCTLGASAVATSAASTSVNGQAPFAIATLSSTSTSYAASTLLPAVHWDHPVDDIQNLSPSSNSDLYYSAGGVSDPSIQHLFASLSATLSYECVILEHSSYVASTSCSDDGILVTFTSVEAFNFAYEAWSEVASGFVLVTYTDGCHGDSDQQRTFWLIDSLELLNSTLSIQAVVQEELAIEDAVYGVEMVWGTYYPSFNQTNGTFSASNSNSTSGSAVSSSGSSNSTSSSNTTTNGSSCGAAPSFTIDGLPAVDCGDANFDTNLDSLIGYLDFSSADYASSIQDFAPDISFDAEDLNDDETQLDRRSLQLRKRGFFWNGPKAIVKAVVHVTVAVVTAPAKIIATAVKSIPVVGNLITKASEFDPSISGQKDFNFGPDASADSPWGKAAQIYTKAKTSSTDSSNTADITIYCVDCGVKGHVALTGQAKWNILDGLHGLNAAINANIEAGVNLGLVANAVYSDTKSKQLINAPLPGVGVAVPKLFTAGVFLSVDAVSKVSVTAEGQALVGVVMTIPNFQASLNLFDQDGAGKSGITGLTPTFAKRFEASGKIAASLQLSLPIAINVGIEVPPLSLKRTIALIEEPSIYGNLTVAASTDNVAPASDTCNNGIEYFANLQNDVKFDFLGLKTFNLNHYDSPPLLQGCKQFGSSTTTAAISATDASTAPDATSTSDGSATTTDPTSTVDTETAVADASVTDTSHSTAASTTTDPTSDPTDTTDSASNPPSTTDVSTTAAAPTDSSVSSDVQATVGTSGTTISATPDSQETETVGRRSMLTRRQDNGTSTDTVAAGDLVFEDDGETTFDDDISDTSDQTDDAVDDDSDSADSTEYQGDTEKALEEASADEDEDGVTFTTIVDVQNTFALAPGENGNLYAAAIDGTDNGTALFSLYDTVIVGDDGERLLHYYPDEMAVYNASRIRLSYEDQIPKTADVITLSPIDYDSTSSSNPSVYFAVDSKSNTYNLVLCDFSNGADSKVFIVNDESGIDALTGNVNMRYTVTGAPVTQCYGLAMVAGQSANSTTSS